jgi:hypothetical protein
MEEGKEQENYRDEIFSKSVRAGKRTYFFDVKSTKGKDLYLTITESKKRFNDDGKFFFEKHKLFLYKEDFDKFEEGFREALEAISKLKESGEYPDLKSDNFNEKSEESKPEKSSEGFTDVSFDDL